MDMHKLVNFSVFALLLLSTQMPGTCSGAPAIGKTTRIYPDMDLMYPQYLPDGETVLAHEPMNTADKQYGSQPERDPRYRFRLWLLYMTKTHKRLLAENVYGHARLSPNGNLVAFQGRDADSGLFFAAVLSISAKTGTKKIFSSSMTLVVEGWEESGGAFILSAREEEYTPYDTHEWLPKALWRIDILTGKATRIFQNPFEQIIFKQRVRWEEPDLTVRGEYPGWHENCDVFLRRGTESIRVHSTPAPLMDYGEPWRPKYALLSGDQVLLEEFAPDIKNRENDVTNVALVNYKTKESNKIIRGIWSIWSDFYTSPNGRYVAFGAGWRDDPFTAYIVVVDTKQKLWSRKEGVRVEHWREVASWSPLNDSFIFVQQEQVSSKMVLLYPKDKLSGVAGRDTESKDRDLIFHRLYLATLAGTD